MPLVDSRPNRATALGANRHKENPKTKKSLVPTLQQALAHQGCPAATKGSSV